MRTGSSATQFRGHRGGLRVDTRLKRARKSRHYQIDLEGLEARTLLATAPAAAPTTIDGTPLGPVNLTSLETVGNNGNANSPTVAVDPYDSQKVFAVWGVDLSTLSPVPITNAVVEGAYSSDGGTNWTSLGTSVNPVFFPDPLTINNTPPTPYTQVTEPSVAFDSRGDVYVLALQTSGASDGAMILTEFNFSGSAPNEVTLPNSGIVYQWVTGSDAATTPTLAVDSGTYPSGTTPPAGVPTDPYVNNVYIAWTSIDTEPANPNPYTVTGFNPNRAELVVGTPISNPSVPNESSLAFSGVTTVNLTGNFGPVNLGTHPQLVINPGNTTNSNQTSINPGQITIAWEDAGTGAKLTPPVTFLLSDIVNPGDSYGFNGNTGLIQAGTSSNSPGNWGTAIVYPAGNSSTNAADPMGIATLTIADSNSTDVNGDGTDDIVVADEYPAQGSGAIGVLENSGTGTFPTTSIYGAGTAPDSVALATFYNHNSTTPVLDAAVANASGGESTLANGLPPSSKQGQFQLQNQYKYPLASGTTAVTAINLGAAGAATNDLVTVDPGTNTVTVLNSVTGVVIAQFTGAADGLSDPIAVAVGNFGSGFADIAVLNAGTGHDDSSVKIFLNTSTPTAISFNTSLPAFQLNANAVSMAAGNLTGNASLLDLAVVTSTFFGSELMVLQNESTPSSVSFNPLTVASLTGGTPVMGQQGVAVGDLSNAGNHAAYQDIAVLYAAFGTNESTVAVFQNLNDPILHTFQLTGNFDALQTNPTAIALLFLTNNSVTPTPKTPWEDIVVTNNDNDDPRDTTPLAGTVSVLQPTTSPTVTTPIGTPFNDVVKVPNPGAIDNLTVTVALTDDQSVGNLSLILMAPNGSTITLLDNANLPGGTAIKPPQGYANGNAIGVYGFSTTTPGIAVGTIFDDNATRNIFDATTTGTNGNSASASIGYFQAEGGSLQSFVTSLGGAINGTWRLVITNYSSTAPAFGFLEQFSLQFSTRMTPPPGVTPSSIAGEFAYVYPTNYPVPFNTIVVGGSLTNTYPTTAPSTPNGVGPGLVLAEDNTLGPYSPYQGRIYAAFVGYFNVAAPTAAFKNPTTNTDIFLVYSDNGGETWSSPELINDDQSISDGESQSNDTLTGNNEITGRTQFGPEIAVDQSTGTVVLSWRDARDDAANARVATYITTSIDGGNTFGPETYANPSKTAVDAITGQTNIIGPASDNEAGGNGQRDTTFGYGDQMGLAVADGQLFPIWAGNFYGPDPAATDFIDSFYNTSTGAVNAFPLNIWYQPMTIASGPRIISSTMGPVVDTTLTGSAVDTALPYPVKFIPPVSSPPGTTTTSVIPITGDPSLNVSSAVGSIQVTVSLIYPTDGNLTLTLVAPNGQTVILYQDPSDKGQNFGNATTSTTFSDSAAGLITSGTAPYAGTFRPVQALSKFAGIQAVGNWSLEVSGGIGPNGGILQSWSLSINGVASKPTSFEVTFDRPVDPQALLNVGQGTFTAGDVEVSYHNTTNGSASIPLKVLSVTPVVPPYYVTDPTQDGVDGYTTFLVTVDPDEMPNGSASGITDYTGTYSYVVAPDNGAVLPQGATPTPIAAPIWSYNTVPQPQPVISPATDPNAKVSPNLSIPTWGPGGSGTQFDETTSTITLNSPSYNNETISGLTVNLNINDPLASPGLGNDGDLFIELIAPDGSTTVLYEKFGDTNQNFTNVTFSDHAAQSILLANGPYTNGTFQPNSPLTALNGSAVNGPYQLVIDNYSSINSGTLLSWSISVSTTKYGVQFESGAAMDQNADGTSDENPLTTPFTGLTPGDAYVAPMPQPTVPFTFNASNILDPPFDQNTLPLIMPGPYVVTTSVPNGGSDNLVLNGTDSSLNVTFDRPIQTSTFNAGQVLQIMGPTGSISGPQSYSSDDTLQTIPAATTTGSGVLPSTLTIPSFDGTFAVADITVQLNAILPTGSNVTAVLMAPDGTSVTLFSSIGANGATFINTTFDDAAENSLAPGTTSFSGSYKPAGQLSTLDGSTVDMKNPLDPALWVPGVWKLLLTNTEPGGTGILENWSLNITPVITVKPVNPVSGLATTFTVGFPQQELSGTYTLQIGPDPLTGKFPLDAAGDAVDSSLDAGLSVLRGGTSTSPVTTVRYTASDVPTVIPASFGASSPPVTSTIIVPDDFMVQGDTTSSNVSGLRVTLNLSYPSDPNLTLTLDHYDLNGNLLGSVPLATNVGSGSNQTANFSNTVFDDNATTPIQNGGAPFFATFNPQMPLSAFAGMSAQGTWVLVVQNSGEGSGTINSWSLTFQKPVPTSGLGVPGADDINTSFRIFNLGQADAMSAEAWTPVGAASISATPQNLGSTTATGASPESTTANRSGRVTGVAVDPSDPTGNTVYAAGASGGVWKTTDFLTTDPAGPTWISLTDFGPSNAINIGSITVMPRNDNVNQTVIIAATGEGNTGTAGVGFLISMDGGATWSLDDSSVNVDSSGNPLPIETNIASLQRNRTFVGDTAYQVVVDPKLTPSGQVIIYAALSGPTGGIWRSEDTGAHWVNMLPGQATSVVLDADSGGVLNPDTDTTVQGNLQVVYAGIRGVGVEMSPNQGQLWTVMNGGIGNPLIINLYVGAGANVNPTNGPTPNGAEGRIALAVPSATGNAAEDPIYEGWLYAAVAAPNNSFFGLFVTKDFGANWTEVSIPSLPAITATAQAVPTNDVTQPTYPITGLPGQSNYDLTLLSDPTNPNVVYLGGSEDGGETALARVDTTNIWDAHSLVAYSNFSNDGGSLNLSSTGPATITSPIVAPPFVENEVLGQDFTSYENFIRNPQDPFDVNATLDVYDYNSFTNNGAGVTWIPFDPGGTDYHAVTAMVDPLTGLPRLIFGNDQGVWTILDNNGTFETQVGSSASGVTLGSSTDQLAGVDRNGNLQITQFYYGATQPSTAAAEIAGALFYGSAQDDGGPVSDPNIISDGNITWSGPGGDATGVGTDQQGLGTAYQFFWPCCGGNDTNFFQYIGPGLSGTGLGSSGELTGGYVGRTSGLLQASNNLPTPDPQWPYVAGDNFAVNPVNSADVVISSSVGRIFVTQDSGVNWFDVGDPSVFGSPNSSSLALAYGAPDPNAPEGVGNLGNFIYVGTATGQIYVTQDGGGSGGSNNWINISAGLDGSAVKSITTDPIRGSHDAYAVTTTGVFYMANSIPVNFTGTLTIGSPTVTGVSSTTGLVVGESVTSTAIPAGTTITAINSLTDTITLSANATVGGSQSLTGAIAWVNITNNLRTLAYSIFGQNYNPTTDTANSVTLNQAISLAAVVADWRYQIPNTTGGGYHPVLYVGAGGSGSNGSGVFQSLDNGATWTLFPSLTYGAVAQGGDLPHAPVTDLNVSLGNVDANTGMPTLAGPDQAFVFTGTLTSGSASVTGVQIPTLVNTSTPALAAGDSITGTDIPSGTTILSVSPSTNTITLSAPAIASGSQTLAASNPATVPDPDVLLATTYGRGQFAINLAPLILQNPTSSNFVTLTPTTAASTPNSPPIVTGPITINGSSEITGFGNTTWITVEDVTNPADPTIIAGFNPKDGAAIPGASNSTNAQGNFSIAFDPSTNALYQKSGNGLKTIEIFATDNAGSVGNVVTISFTLDIPGLAPPSPPLTPTLSLASYDVAPTAAPGYTNVRTPNLIGVTSPNVTVELFQIIAGSTTPTPFSPVVTTTSNASGDFTLTFPDMTGGGTGTFGPYTVVAQASSSFPTPSGFSTPPTTFTIIVGAPAPPKNFRLAPASDTGIVGDDITADRTPDYIGTTVGGATVKLFESNGTNYATTTANASGNFSVQLPFALTNGTISLYVEATDLAGNLSAPSNLLTVTIVSIASDYNGDGVSDPALFSRNTATNELQWLVQSTVLPSVGSAPPPWFVMPIVFGGTLKSGSTSVTGISSTAALVAGQVVTGTGIASGTTILAVNGTTSITLSASAIASGLQTLSASTPANVVPFQGDFDGDGKTDLAYYQLSTATWYFYDSKSQTASSFALGTPNASVPVVGYFDANAPEEAAVYTDVNGQGVWMIASAITGLHTVTLPFPVQATDIPVPGNYDGVGHDELAIYRPTTGQYLVDDNGTTETINIPGIGVGTPDLSSLVPVPGNYNPHLNTASPPAWIENTEAAVYDPNTGVYTILGPNGVDPVPSGFQKGDIPAPADYLGNGSTQPAVFRPSTGQFIGAGGVIIATLGTSSDIPLAAPLSYRVPGFQPAGQTGTGTTGTGTTGTGSTGTGTTGTGSTGTGTTGTGSTGTGTTGTGSTGTGTTGTGSTGTGTTGTGSGTSSATPPPAQSPGPGLTHPGTSTHKKKVAKHKPVVHPKKPIVHKKVKTVQHHAAKPKVHVVTHKVTKVVTSSASSSAQSRAHVIDLALEDIHVNLRRSSSAKKYHG